MAGKKHYKKINIDVEPFLSIMAIVLKLISLILVVIVMRIAANKQGIKVVNLLQRTARKAADVIKSPSYVDCYVDHVVLYPGAITNTWSDLQNPENAVEKMLAHVDAKSETDYVVIMARPDAVKIFRSIRKMLGEHPKVEVGYDVVDTDFKPDWDAAVQAMGVKE